MIACIIIVTLALVWLGYETKWLSVRLPVGKTANKTLLLTQGEYKQPLLLATPIIHFKPSVFEPLEMPEFKGTLDIICHEVK